MTIVGRAEQVFPDARAIQWAPRDTIGRGAAEAAGRPRVCITQSAIVRLEHDILSRRDPGLGFLLGSLYRCPRTGVEYCITDRTDPWPGDPDDVLNAPPSFEALRDAAALASTVHARPILGWYHVRARVQPRLPKDDAPMQRYVLTAPWQSTLIIAPTLNGPTGAFYLLDHATSEIYLAPFYEVIEDDAAPGSVKRTCVAWTEYVVTEPVMALAPTERRALATAARATAAHATAPPKAPPEPTPPRRALDADPGAGEHGASTAALAGQGAAPTAPSGAVGFPFFVPPRAEGGHEPRAERPQRTRTRIMAAVLFLLATVSFGGAFAWMRACGVTRPPPPETRHVPRADARDSRTTGGSGGVAATRRPAERR